MIDCILIFCPALKPDDIDTTIPMSSPATLSTLIVVEVAPAAGAVKETPVRVTDDADAGIEVFKFPFAVSIVVPGSIPGPDRTIPGTKSGLAKSGGNTRFRDSESTLKRLASKVPVAEVVALELRVTTPPLMDLT